MTTLTGKQRKYLRGLAHNLDPVVMVGQRGVTGSVVRQVDLALTDHELIKVKVGGECPVDREEAAGILAMQTECEVAGTIGRIVILYRPRREKPTIELPAAGDDGASD